MSKKILIILIILVIASVGFGVWLFLFSENSGGGISQTEEKDLFPFGQGGETPGQTGTTIPENVTAPSTESTYIPRLRKITSTPTAGGVVFDDKTRTTIRYIERATGHVFETYSDSVDVVRISNTTIPKIEEALWSPKGNELILRYLRDDDQTIRTFYARISTTTSPDQAIEGIFLPDDIRRINLLNDRIFYTTKTTTGSTGIIAGLDGSKKTALINSSFGDWSHSWGNPSQVLLFPSPSALASGFIYTLNTSSGEYLKASQSAPGLSGLGNSDGSLILLSGKKASGIGTAVLDTKTGETTNLSLQTMTDKCVWSVLEKTVLYCAIPQALPAGNYPDAWYQGIVSTSDSLWRIDTETGNTEEIASPQIEALEDLDIENMSLNQNESMLLFRNKKDLSLWVYRFSI